MHNPVGITWLGQAGFLIEYGQTRIVIDPYLSDSLYAKYKNTRYPHVRMMQSPLNPREIHGLSFVLCTHGHTDHMDPGTLPVLADASPACRFICPASEREKAIGRGVPADRFIGMVQDEVLDDSESSGLIISATASAHEQLETDSAGRSLFLGYVIRMGDLSVYHSGDCVPYEGLSRHLGKLKIDAALLPVNGRDEARARNGVPGNFDVHEAVDLCRGSGIPKIIPHHFGMFDFNTEDPEIIEKTLKKSGLEYIIPVAGKKYNL